MGDLMEMEGTRSRTGLGQYIFDFENYTPLIYQCLGYVIAALIITNISKQKLSK